LYGPITTIRRDGRITKNIPWTAFQTEKHDWGRVSDVKNILAVCPNHSPFFLVVTPFLKDANSILHYFSSERHPTLWRAIPAIERLQSAWEAKRDHPRYELYSKALTDGLEKIRKYYLRFDEKPAYIVSLSTSQCSVTSINTPLTCMTVLHPYYKLNYIQMAWGGPKEQQEEIAKGNLGAKNWQAEARKVIEGMVRFVFCSCSDAADDIRWSLTTATINI